MAEVKILYIGRFQPFHNGHLKLIKNIKDKYDEIIIGIGSSQYGFDEKNPFTIKERRLMIEKTLEYNKIKNYVIFEIPDIHNYPKWVSHVESIISKFDIVIANNPLTIELFKKKGYKVIKTKLYNRNILSGEEIRKKIVNNQNWEKTVPKEVYKIIMDIDGIKRIKNLANKI